MRLVSGLLVASTPQLDVGVARRLGVSVGVKWRAGSNGSSAETILVLVHEMVHAKYCHEGISTKAANLPRDQYIEKVIEEEAEATVTSVEASIDLGRAKLGDSQI